MSTGRAPDEHGTGTELVLTLDAHDPAPPFEQVRRQVAELIGAGRLADGQRLPSLRKLAADLGLAVGTVARAYTELEELGLVVSRRGGGTRVVAPSAPGLGAGALRGAAEGFVATARGLGARDEAVLAAVQAALTPSRPATRLVSAGARPPAPDAARGAALSGGASPDDGPAGAGAAPAPRGRSTPG